MEVVYFEFEVTKPLEQKPSTLLQALKNELCSLGRTTQRLVHIIT